MSGARLGATVALALLAACGGASPTAGPTATAPASPTPIPTATPVATPTAVATPTPAASPSPAPSPEPTMTPTEPPSTPTPMATRGFTLTSTAFEEGEEIPVRHSCHGRDVSPELGWSGAPDETAELALIVDDPDAGGFIHWVLVGIPPSPEEMLEEGRGDAAAHPEGQGMNDFGQMGWFGPCPPSRHTYVFTLYALAAPITVPDPPTADEVRMAMEGLILAQAELRGVYTPTR